MLLPPYMPMNDLAKLAGVSRQRIHQAIRSGTIEAHKVANGRLVIPGAEAQRFLKQRGVEAEFDLRTPTPEEAEAFAAKHLTNRTNGDRSRQLQRLKDNFEPRMEAFEVSGARLRVAAATTNLEEAELAGIGAAYYYLMRRLHVIFKATEGQYNDFDPQLDSFAKALAEHLKAYFDILNFSEKNHYELPDDYRAVLIARVDATAESIRERYQ